MKNKPVHLVLAVFNGEYTGRTPVWLKVLPGGLTVAVP